jgi:outer membrane lipoprotein-sorting protein
VHRLRGIGVLLSLACVSPALIWTRHLVFAAAPTQSGQLGKIIAQLDAASVRFRSAQADFTWDNYVAAVQDHEIQSGTIYFERRNGTTQMAAYIRPAAGQNAESSRTVVFDGSEFQLYQPAIKQMTILRAESNQAQTEAFLTLGFGGSGSSLMANWDVSFLGTDTLDGVSVVELDLKPKTQKISSIFTHVAIWLDTSRGISLKQIFYQPSGDMRTTTYTNIKYNEQLPKDIFHIKTAPGTTVQRK